MSAQAGALLFIGHLKVEARLVGPRQYANGALELDSEAKVESDRQYRAGAQTYAGIWNFEHND